MKIESLLKKDEIDGSELEQMIELRKKNQLDFVLIDVREEYEFNNQHNHCCNLLKKLHNKATHAFTTV